MSSYHSFLQYSNQMANNTWLQLQILYRGEVPEATYKKNVYD